MKLLGVEDELQGPKIERSISANSPMEPVSLADLAGLARGLHDGAVSRKKTRRTGVGCSSSESPQ